MGATVLQHAFVNHAQQFQWLLDNHGINTSWTMRMDADEYITPELTEEIKAGIPQLSDSISGIELKRRVHFMGRWIRHGGYYPIKLLRIWRTGHAFVEQRWMDEHIVLTKGQIISFQHDFIDDNKRNLTWWTSKHNDYASREMIDILNHSYRFFESPAEQSPGIQIKQANIKRKYKLNYYLRMPQFLRCLFYFLFRYIIRLGFLDGKEGLIWHFLQGFWYRFLVDAKVYHVLKLAANSKQTVKEVIEEEYKIKIH